MPETRTPNLAIISGEMSGDLVGGALARELKRLRPDLQVWGTGGRHMGSAGVELFYDSSLWGAISIVETLKLYPYLRFVAFPRVVSEIKRRRPCAVVLIDFGAFNVKVASRIKPCGIPVLYYFPPGSWRKQGPVNPQIGRVTDQIATPFPWSENRLRGSGANATFVGHPLIELVKPTITRSEFADRFGMDPGLPIIGLLPGSRSFEVEYNTPAMLGAAALISAQMPDAQFVFGLASNKVRDRVESALNQSLWTARDSASKQAASTIENLADKGINRLQEKLGLGRSRVQMVTPEGVVVSGDALKRASRAGNERRGAVIPPVVLVENMTYDVMAHSDALIICSGTATLEAALLGTPMSIIYRGSKLMEKEAAIRRIRPEHIGMPNIIAEERIVPEFIQQEATPEALADQTLLFLGDPAIRGSAKVALANVRRVLGEPGASERTARMALELAGLAVGECR